MSGHLIEALFWAFLCVVYLTGTEPAWWMPPMMAGFLCLSALMSHFRSLL